MQIQGKSEFARMPVLENCAFFTCVQCGYCGYLILGGSGKELLEEKKRHAIDCKATHSLIGAVRRRAPEQKPRVRRDTRVLMWSRAVFIGIAWLCALECHVLHAFKDSSQKDRSQNQAFMQEKNCHDSLCALSPDWVALVLDS
jgi:hypothetical protein